MHTYMYAHIHACKCLHTHSCEHMSSSMWDRNKKRRLREEYGNMKKDLEGVGRKEHGSHMCIYLFIERLSAAYESFCASAAFNTLQHTAIHCNTLQYTTKHCRALQHTAAHCNVLQRTPSHCFECCYQHAATYSNTHQAGAITAIRCNSPQHTATHTRRALRKHLFQLQAAVAYNGHSDADAQKCTSDISQPRSNTSPPPQPSVHICAAHYTAHACGTWVNRCRRFSKDALLFARAACWWTHVLIFAPSWQKWAANGGLWRIIKVFPWTLFARAGRQVSLLKIDWCWFYYFVRNSLVALLEALRAQVRFVCWSLCCLLQSLLSVEVSFVCRSLFCLLKSLFLLKSLLSVAVSFVRHVASVLSSLYFVKSLF